jgi:choline-sulfatase
VSERRRPNILVLMADQLAPSALPFHGDPATVAPAMTSLAENGVVFDAAYTPSPLCAPARASLLTGRLPSRTAAYDNAAAFPSHLPTFAHYLRGAGYRTALVGKMHFCGPDQLHGFEERLTTDIYPADFGWTPDWDHPDDRPHWYHDMSSVVDAGVCVRSNQLDFDDEVAFAAQRLLFDHARGDDDRPFCFVVSFTHPHDPYAIQQEWWDRYDDIDIPGPVHGYDESSATPHERRLRHVCAMDEQEPDETQSQAALRAYRGAISYVDDKIGRLLAVLRDTGQLDDTVVVLTSDHGDMLGERGLWYKMSFFEGSARVPLVISAPPRFQARRVATPVSTTDLLPTLVALANNGDVSGIVDDLDGFSLVAMMAGEAGAAEQRGPVLAEYLAEGAIAPIVMVRRGDLKLVHSPSDPDQLYDLADDPLERINLVGADRYAEDYLELRTFADQHWNFDALDARVRLSQRRRLAVTAAAQHGQPPAWDYTPPVDASRQYIRNHMDLGALETRARYPSVKGVTATDP